MTDSQALFALRDQIAARLAEFVNTPGPDVGAEALAEALIVEFSIHPTKGVTMAEAARRRLGDNSGEFDPDTVHAWREPAWQNLVRASLEREGGVHPPGHLLIQPVGAGAVPGDLASLQVEWGRGIERRGFVFTGRPAKNLLGLP